ncbi:MAG TPA: ABC transporter permease [Streptosporangiaceae bacterium]|nr:ABC transporter permease [Streptosporangiaceae bacterium]
MFFTYLWRELRRRLRQAVLIALGLALGVGLVITVTAASDGVTASQATVLHTLYGVGTDITVTQPPAKGSGGGTSFGFRQEIKNVRAGQIAAGTKININQLVSSQYGTMSSGSLAQAARLDGVSSVAGGLALTDVTVSGTVPPLSAGSGSFSSSFTTNTFTVDGVDLSRASLGPLSAAKLTAGRALAPADAHANDVLVNASYATANKLGVGGKLVIGGTSFTITGIASVPQSGNPPDAYIPLARAQAIGQASASTKLGGKVNTLYVSAASAADIPAVQAGLHRLLPGATVTDASDLAGEVTGSLASASSLAANLGRWLSAAVLAAAFGVASVLTMAAVSRRVREFGTLKALGWRSRRIVGQVMGESLAIGAAGAVIGVALGYGGTALIDRLAPKLTATVGASNAASVSGPGRLLSPGAAQALSGAGHSVSVTLSAPVTLGAVGLAVLLAVAGGLIAGSFGGWRAARLRPASALARVA